jgi:hypothetical protein
VVVGRPQDGARTSLRGRSSLPNAPVRRKPCPGINRNDNDVVYDFVLNDNLSYNRVASAVRGVPRFAAICRGGVTNS